MKIIDCITYFNEPLLFELRLNILEKFVDEFIVCEARYTHAGEKKKLNFNIDDFKKFKKKINYIIIDD
jgi:beta-1,4-mannosyl-glycoprotein beta-1,4-N-acetylglucosaminyltransferase